METLNREMQILPTGERPGLTGGWVRSFLLKMSFLFYLGSLRVRSGSLKSSEVDGSLVGFVWFWARKRGKEEHQKTQTLLAEHHRDLLPPVVFFAPVHMAITMIQSRFNHDHTRSGSSDGSSRWSLRRSLFIRTAGEQQPQSPPHHSQATIRSTPLIQHPSPPSKLRTTLTVGALDTLLRPWANKPLF
ncbi:hypothetical protein RYX36_012970 [Vicia faba]